MSRRRLLLVEENSTLRLMIEKHLRREGICEVEATDEAPNALERVELGGYDLVVASLELQNYPPARLLNELAAMRPAPLVLTTGSPKSLESLDPKLAPVIWESIPLPLTRTRLTWILARALQHIADKGCSTLVPSAGTCDGAPQSGKRRRRTSGPVGYKLGRYELLECLGQSAKGAVYRGLIPASGRTVAVRVFPRELLERLGRGRWWREWFNREVNAATAVSDPHVSAVVDYGATDDESCLYLVTELIDGQTLAQQLREGPLPPVEAVQMALHVARALEAIHAVGFAHRQVRPTNVILDSEGNATLTDVGVANILAWDLVSSREQGQTMPYASPEQLSFAHVDDRSDQFALGLSLYEALTGRSPFRGESPEGRLRSILNDDPDLSLDEVSQGRDKLREILGAMLARSSEERYQGDVELQAALKVSLTALEEAAG